MATTAAPYRGGERPNIPSAAKRFPAIHDYEQVDREIAGTLRPTLGWFAALGIAILCMLIGATTWTYQIHEGLGAAGTVSVAMRRLPYRAAGAPSRAAAGLG
jgi:hypothetical protein